jgi:hypothetical protein
MSMNWLEGMHNHMDEPGRSQAMPVFAGQKLVVVGGSSGIGRQAAADVVAAWPAPSPSCSPRPPAGSPEPSGTSTAASWPGATNDPHARAPASHPALGPCPLHGGARKCGP